MAAGSSRSSVCICGVRTRFWARTEKKATVPPAASPGLLVSPVLRSGAARVFASQTDGPRR